MAKNVRKLLLARGPCIPGTDFKQRFREHHGFELDLGSGKLLDVLRRCEGEGVCELEMRPMTNGPPLFFVHAIGGHMAALPKNYKTVLCRNWNGNLGSCIFGPKCMFAHGEEELHRTSVLALDPLQAPPVPSVMELVERLEDSDAGVRKVVVEELKWLEPGTLAQHGAALVATLED